MELWKDKIRKVVPYVPGEQPNMPDIVKLNTNECPYPPSPLVEKAIREFNTSDLRKYPSILCAELRSALTKSYPVGAENLFSDIF